MPNILDYPERTLSDQQRQRLKDAIQKIRLATRLLFILAGFEIVLIFVRYRIGLYDIDQLLLGMVIPFVYGFCGFLAARFPLPSLAIAFLAYLASTGYAIFLTGDTQTESLLWRGVAAIVLIVGLINAVQAHQLVRSLEDPE